MPFNGSGAYSPPGANYPAVSNTLITAANRNGVDADIATALSNVICKDGQTTVTANIPLGGNKLTGVGAATARTDAATLASIQDATGVFVAGGGTVDAITATYSPAITAVVDGMILAVRAAGANTSTTPSFSPNSLPARTIVKQGGQALAVGDIRAANHDLLLRYRATGTVWELLNPTLPAAPSGAITSSAYTMTTARLLGRTTASTGAIEELTVGASLTLSGGSLSGTAASSTQAGVIEIAVQAEMETPSSGTLAVPPSMVNFHPGVAKAWVKANVTGTVLASHNITSVTDDGTGLVTVTIATDFADANYCISPGAVLSTAVGYSLKLNSQAAGSFQMDGRNSGSGAALDPETWHASCFGDQA